MTDDLDKQSHIERNKTIRAALMFAALLLLAAILFGVYRFVTAPVRVAQDTTETVTRKIEEQATAVLTRRHIAVREGRRLARLSDAAHAVLAQLPETEPATMSERAFRLAHLRGSQGKVCRMDMNFGAGAMPVWVAADNADFTANRSLGGDAERQIRIVWDTPGDVLGVSVQYAAQYTDKDDAPHWELLWRRRDSVSKPLTDVVMGERTLNVLDAIPKRCGATLP